MVMKHTKVQYPWDPVEQAGFNCRDRAASVRLIAAQPQAMHSGENSVGWTPAKSQLPTGDD
ncbi:MAG: hypothetical protein DMG70_16860 [Acidobacteria bacterium]|nr:MAG: hypothetical protein DMG70_16860 [Acidobacteriota bacterium]PYY08517.1 MAG: hypothetical protein DMG69_14915 [Acidobacteriota bacterium]